MSLPTRRAESAWMILFGLDRHIVSDDAKHNLDFKGNDTKAWAGGQKTCAAWSTFVEPRVERFKRSN